MSTLFEIVFEKGKAPYATNKVRPENKWAITEGIATRKFDGTSVAIIKGKLFKRFDMKKGRKLPEGAIECQSADKITGHHPHWVPCLENDKHHWEAFNKQEKWEDGTYELCGPKVQKNPEGFENHVLVRHGTQELNIQNRTFESLMKFCEKEDIEGIVFHHPDGRMCKIRKKDFGIKR